MWKYDATRAYFIGHQCSDIAEFKLSLSTRETNLLLSVLFEESCHDLTFFPPSFETLLFIPIPLVWGARFINRDMDLIDIPDFYNSPSSRIMVGKVWDRWWSGLIRSAIIGVARNWMYRAITRGPNRHFGPINDMDSWLGDVRLRGSIRH